eukprot:6383874-Amphidinium_carterae.1
MAESGLGLTFWPPTKNFSSLECSSVVIQSALLINKKIEPHQQPSDTGERPKHAGGYRIMKARSRHGTRPKRREVCTVAVRDLTPAASELQI